MEFRKRYVVRNINDQMKVRWASTVSKVNKAPSALGIQSLEDCGDFLRKYRKDEIWVCRGGGT